MTLPTPPHWLNQILYGKNVRFNSADLGIPLTALPPLVLGGYTLSIADVDRLLRVLREQIQREPPDALWQLKEQTQSTDWDTFLFKLLELWQNESVGKEWNNWILYIVAQLGGEKLVPTLIALHVNQPIDWKTALTADDLPQDRLRLFTSAVHRPKGTMQIEKLLVTQGSPSALFYLLLCWFSNPLKGYEYANAIKQAARERKIAYQQLAERALPSIDLSGYRFDYGSRSFTLAFGAELVPFARDPQGRLHPHLPDPLPADQPELVKIAQQEWQTCLQFVQDVKALSTLILEQAMVDERWWSVHDFKQLFFQHPLMRYFAQTLVWGTTDFEGKVVETFRIVEDFTLADRHDSFYPLDKLKGNRVGIVHPLRLTAEQRDQWSEILLDYNIIQPFPQVSRGLPVLENPDLSGDEYRLVIRSGQRVGVNITQIASVISPLSGWEYNSMKRGGYTLMRQFSQRKYTANLRFTVNSNSFEYAYFEYGESLKLVPLTEVPPLVLNETLRMIDLLTTYQESDV